MFYLFIFEGKIVMINFGSSNTDEAYCKARSRGSVQVPADRLMSIIY